MIVTAGEAANINPRSGRLLANVFKILRLIWTKSKAVPETNVQKTILIVIAMSTSYPLLMGSVLEKLETELKKDPANDQTLCDFVKKEIKTYKSRHWSSRVLSDCDWGDVTLKQIGSVNVRLLRSFSFVGNYRDDEYEISEVDEMSEVNERTPLLATTRVP